MHRTYNQPSGRVRARLLRSLLPPLAGALLYPAAAQAQATVVVPPNKGFSWAIRDLQLFPRKKADGGIDVAQASEWLNRDRGMKQPVQLCYMDFLQNNEIASLDVDTTKEIAADLKQYPNSFATSWTEAPGATFLARIAAFEDCPDPTEPGDPQRFLALVITDAQNRIKLIDATRWSFIRVFKRDDGHVNVLGCFACGEVMEIAWDQPKDRFYFVDIGH